MARMWTIENGRRQRGMDGQRVGRAFAAERPAFDGAPDQRRQRPEHQDAGAFPEERLPSLQMPPLAARLHQHRSGVDQTIASPTGIK